jgi:hypothetical protein
MGNYFLNINKQEKQNILDKHKTVYDGFVTKYGQSINNQPLYVQDFANDKNGITVSNKGVVKPYTNVNINEINIPIDNVGLKRNIDLDFNNYKDEDEDDTDWVNQLMSSGDELGEETNEFDLYTEIDEDEQEPLKDNVYESLNMFKRFKKYN